MREGDFLKTYESWLKEIDMPGALPPMPTEFNFGSELHRDVIIDDPSFAYGHYAIGKGQATVGGVRLGDKLYYAIAFCSPSDNFSKTLGRNYVCEHLILPEQSHKRGVMILDGAATEQPPAVLLKYALEYHLSKMKNRPHWLRRDFKVDFRTTPKQSKKEFRRPHGTTLPLGRR